MLSLLCLIAYLNAKNLNDHMDSRVMEHESFASCGRLDEELDVRSGKASVVTRALHHSVVKKRELSRKAKHWMFKSILVPILTYGHES